MMSEQANSEWSDLTMLTPRQDRVEATLVALLCAGATRSELRDAANRLSEAYVSQNVACDDALVRVRSLVERASPVMSANGARGVGDAPADRAVMLERWIRARYQRAD